MDLDPKWSIKEVIHGWIHSSSKTGGGMGG